MRKMNDAVAIPGEYQDRALHAGNPVQRFWHESKLILIRRLLKPQPSDSILDLGCGSGVCCGFLGESGARVLGLDSNPAAVDFATRAYSSDRVAFRLAYVDSTLPAHFSKAISFEVAEHLFPDQFRNALDHLHHSIEPGGLLLLTTPNYASFWPLLEMLLDLFRLVPRLKGEQHVARYTHRRLRRVCENAGFQLVKERSICTVGPWIAPFSRRLAELATEWELTHRVPGGTILAHLYRNT